MGKILDLLSLASISRFLTLDFTPVKKNNGFSFYYIQGGVHLQNGLLTAQTVTMDSPVAKIDFSGNINLLTEQNNLMMHVAPTIASSKPSMAGFPIGPIIRLPIWVLKKIMSPIINPLLEVNYQVTGTLSKPVVKKII